MISRRDQDDVAVLTMTHGKANALDLEFCTELDYLVTDLARDPCRAVVLTGQGILFSAGVDLRRLLAEPEDYLDRFLPALERLFRHLFVFPKPLVTAINGHAIAGGCLLAIVADHRVMRADRGTIGVPELLVGVPFPTVGIEVMRYQLGDRLTRDLIYSGRTVHPDEALALGLVDELVAADQVVDAAIAHAMRLATVPAVTFDLTKRQLRRPVLERIERDAAAFDAEVRESWANPDVLAHVEGYVTRLLGKR